MRKQVCLAFKRLIRPVYIISFYFNFKSIKSPSYQVVFVLLSPKMCIFPFGHNWKIQKAKIFETFGTGKKCCF